jgi:archaellum biogenesis ATPase FlaH
VPKLLPPPDHDDQLPPHDDNAELALLGCILEDNSLMDEARKQGVDSTYFFSEARKAIWGNFCFLAGNSLPIKPEIYLKHFKDEPILSDCIAQMEHPLMMPEYIKSVEACLSRRRLIAHATRAVNLAHNTKALPAEIVSETKSLIQRLEHTLSKNGLVKSRNGLSNRSLSEIITMKFDPTDRIIGDKLLTKGNPFTMIGASGVGKSRLSIQLSFCCVTSRQFIGFETRGQDLKFLFLQAENSCERLQDDFLKMKSLFSPEEIEKIDKQVIFHTLETEEDSWLMLSDPDALARIQALIKETNPDVIIFDTLSDFTSDDINKDVAMKDLCRAISKITKTGNPKRTPIILHHSQTGLEGAAKSIGINRSSFSRNSKILHGFTRGQLNLVAIEASKNPPILVSCGKMSNAQPFEDFVIRLNPTTMFYDVVTDVDISEFKEEVTGKKQETPFNPQDFARLLSQPLSRIDLKKAIIDETGCSKASAYRHIQKALDKGIIQDSSKDRSKIILNPLR